MEHQKWWKETVVYQIYPRSYQDSDGDGIGDLPGVISRLDYLAELGIGAVWLSPVSKSPQDDNGYDISDYRDIDPMFGTLADMERLIEEAGRRGIKIVMDLVLNHSSDEHPWFVEAKKSRANPFHDYYVWRDGDPDSPPNDLGSVFGGSAWQYVPELGQYYLHLFSVKQPDLNWENPRVREEIYDMINWWIDKGVGGFRLDVIDLIAKEPDRKITGNGPKLHEYIRELSRATFGRADLLTVGETWGATPESARLYSNPDGSELSMVFQFEHIGLDEKEGWSKWDLAPLDFLKLKAVLSKWQTELGGKAWNSLFWNNHDLPRIVSRWGDDGEYRVQSAKMLATLLHGMQGTPYVYQGEELGMTNVRYPIEDYRDIELLNLYKERTGRGYPHDEVMASIHAKGRDNARTPMQWDASPQAGFTSGEPWIRVNPNYSEINAAEQLKDPDSIFSYYRRLIALRKDRKAIVYGDYELLLPEHRDVFAYTRRLDGDTILVLCNFYGAHVSFDLPGTLTGDRQLLIANYADEPPRGTLRPYEARMYALQA
ncbi:glycoside hydrolase family 13 protein [Cohnella sp. JJ-181]|uniref:glycoside hydrolase family 13 protein n=1 Tax=Cohnella rhizoplanae TaxID=2974897 RepID=UPI0022FF5E89|nr:alpha-glucosidase [Cohnella sp. JJ-181]CAI6087289.1 Oligo-1,6-glucosidase [Cohnella sp. JJ-181]